MSDDQQKPSEINHEQETTQAQAQVKTTEAKPAEAPATESKSVDAAAAEKPTVTAKPTPAKKAAEPAPPDPRVEAAKATAEKIRATIVAAFGEDAVEETGAAHIKPMLRIRPSDWVRTVDMLRTHPDWKLNYVECMAGTDYPDYMEVVIFVQSTDLGHFICLKTRTNRETPKVPSLALVHPSVDWEEREIFDLLGIDFTGHPNMRRIMLADDFKGHPLRKDYSVWD